MFVRAITVACGLLFGFFALRYASEYWYMLDHAALPWWGHAGYLVAMATLGGLTWLMFSRPSKPRLPRPDA